MRSVASICCLVISGLVINSSSLVSAFGVEPKMKFIGLAAQMFLASAVYATGCLLGQERRWVGNAGLVSFWGGVSGCFTIINLLLIRSDAAASEYPPRSNPDIIGEPAFGITYSVVFICLGAIIYRKDRAKSFVRE